MNAPIPEDLQKQFEAHKQWLAIPWHERPKTGPGVEAILRENSVNDINRIAALTQERDELRAEVERLSAALKSIDCASCGGNNLKHKRGCEQAIIARRKP